MQALHLNGPFSVDRAKQHAARLAAADHDPEVTIGQPQFRLIPTTDHRQAHGPPGRIIGIGVSEQAAVEILKAPWSAAPRTEHQLGLDSFQQRLRCRRKGGCITAIQTLRQRGEPLKSITPALTHQGR